MNILPISALLLITHLLIAGYCVGHALLNKDDPRGAFGWVATVILLPFGGVLLYTIFGINRVRSRARKLAERGHSNLSLDPSIVQQTSSLLEELPEQLQPLAQATTTITGLPILGGNQLKILHNGEEAYPAMLEAIAQANKSIWMTTYILRSDSIGKQFCQALIGASERGVEVKLLLDGFGCLWSWPRLKRWLKKSQIEVARFLPPRLIPLSIHGNLRNHRKLLLIDGEVGFTGGMNISNNHLVEPRKGLIKKRGYSDIHFKVHGPILSQMKAVFIEEWEFTTGQEIDFSPNAESDQLDTRDALCRIIADGPTLRQNRLEDAFFSAISIARRRIVIVTPYFLPSRELTAALCTAAQRGVSVYVITPERLDRKAAEWARTKNFSHLLRNNVQILLRPPPFAHSKLFIVDGEFAMIGSANIDPRSMRLNFELGVEIYQSLLVDQIGLHCDDLIHISKPIPADFWEKTPLPIRLRNSLFWLGSPYL